VDIALGETLSGNLAQNIQVSYYNSPVHDTHTFHHKGFSHEHSGNFSQGMWRAHLFSPTNESGLFCENMKISLLIAAMFLSSAAAGQEIIREHINPSSGYTNVVAVTTGDVRTLYISGQVGSGDTLEQQIRSAFEGVLKQLADADSAFSDVVKINTYIVNYRQEDLALFRKVREEMFGQQKMPASTLVGVASLATEAIKVEMEAVAVVAAE
jgi:enamine deaminase RidA (YjgF/YER057c/UK114 family)